MTGTERADEARYSGHDEQIRHRFDWAETSPSEAVSRVVSVASNRGVTAVEPLYESVDLGAVDQLLQSTSSDKFELTFVHDGFRICVQRDGKVVATPVDE
ncbi:HalOD1 output domain-containing protein [Haloarcula marina]|uniref:HalOD1 output domain-containing protein n=1 Tax=Haloarcula marina TaxID=2961574 RepID=UPI0020B7EA0C|nr:HalOD1 output domain-containing protein [Halomicroarcula marina]